MGGDYWHYNSNDYNGANSKMNAYNFNANKMLEHSFNPNSFPPTPSTVAPDSPTMFGNGLRTLSTTSTAALSTASFSKESFANGGAAYPVVPAPVYGFQYAPPARGHDEDYFFAYQNQNLHYNYDQYNLNRPYNNRPENVEMTHWREEVEDDHNNYNAKSNPRAAVTKSQPVPTTPEPPDFVASETVLYRFADAPTSDPHEEDGHALYPFGMCAYYGKQFEEAKNSGLLDFKYKGNFTFLHYAAKKNNGPLLDFLQTYDGAGVEAGAAGVDLDQDHQVEPGDFLARNLIAQQIHLIDDLGKKPADHMNAKKKEHGEMLSILKQMEANFEHMGILVNGPQKENKYQALKAGTWKEQVLERKLSKVKYPGRPSIR
eukprot:g15982.t1